MSLPPNWREVLEATCGLQLMAKNLERVGAQFGHEAARWGFQQHELRKKAAGKFEDASTLLFEPEALEQTTHHKIAQWRASQFPNGELVADLTAGIGADTRALAKRGPVIAYELDPYRFELLKQNVPSATVLNKDCLAESWEFGYAFADPARRKQGIRTLDISQFVPEPFSLSERMRSLRQAAIKLTPMLSDEDLQALGPKVQFLSYGWECREALVWLGTGVDPQPSVSAIHVDTGEELARTWLPVHCNMPEQFLMIADPALVRSHATGNFQVSRLTPNYLTAPAPIESPWFKTFEVLDCVTPNQLKQMKHLNIQSFRQSGTDFDLNELRRKWRVTGDQEVDVAFYAVNRAVRALILKPL